MTEPAQVETPGAAEVLRVDDKMRGLVIRVLLMPGHVPGRGTMAFFTVHAIDDIAVREIFRFDTGGGGNVEIGAMAFQATGGGRPPEDDPVGKSGTVRPLVQFGKIGQWQLQKFIAVPIQECLSPFSGAYGDVQRSAGLLDAVGIFHLPGETVPSFDRKIHTGVKIKSVLRRFDGARDIIRIRSPGREIVSGLYMVLINIVVAICTRRRSGELSKPARIHPRSVSFLWLRGRLLLLVIDAGNEAAGAKQQP